MISLHFTYQCVNLKLQVIWKCLCSQNLQFMIFQSSFRSCFDKNFKCTLESIEIDMSINKPFSFMEIVAKRKKNSDKQNPTFFDIEMSAVEITNTFSSSEINSQNCENNS